jgi:hypothetical protein
MPVNSHIKDGTGSNRSVKVFPDNSLFVSSAALPPVGTGGAGAIIFRQYMTDDGTSTGSSDMKVNGQKVLKRHSLYRLTQRETGI